MVNLKLNLTRQTIASIAVMALLIGGIGFAVYRAIWYVVVPGGGDGFLLAVAVSLVFVFAGNRSAGNKRFKRLYVP